MPSYYIGMSPTRGPSWPFKCLDNYVHSQFPARNLCTPFSRYMVLQVRPGTGHFTTSYITAEQNLPLWDRTFPVRDCHAFVKWTLWKVPEHSPPQSPLDYGRFQVRLFRTTVLGMFPHFYFHIFQRKCFVPVLTPGWHNLWGYRWT